MLILIGSCLLDASRDFHLAHRDLGILVGSWVAVEPNATGLPSDSLYHRRADHPRNYSRYRGI
jgi:hypothetical protein